MRYIGEKAAVQHVILGLLLLSPMSLYDLHRAFGQGISLFYSASFGSIQRALRQLIELGHVDVEPAPDDPRGKKIHTITPSGRTAWHTWMHEPVTGGDAETIVLARVFFLGLIHDDAERAEIIGVLRTRVAGDLDGLRGAAAGVDAQAIPPEFDGVFAFQRATLDYGIRAHELALHWLDGLAVTLRPRTPATTTGFPVSQPVNRDHVITDDLVATYRDDD